MSPIIHADHRLTARVAGVLAFLLAPLVGAAPATAQFEQPRPPGDLATTRIPEREEVRSRSEKAGLHVGPIRLDPYLTFSNLVYTDNVFDAGADEEQISDLRGGLNGGVNAYLPMGSKMVLSGFAGANYVWWKDQEEFRDLRGSYGATLFGLFNRMTMEAGAGRVERQQNLSRELIAPVNLRDDRAFLRLRVDAAAAWTVVGSAETQRLRYGRELEQVLPGVQTGLLDRDTDRVTLGLEYHTPRGLSLGLGAEYAEQDFQEDPAARSNEGFGPTGTIRFAGQRLTLDLVANLRTLEFVGVTEHEDLEELIGTARAGWKVASRSDLVAYGARRLYASALNESSFSITRETGVAVIHELNRRLTARAFVERETDSYQDVASRASLGEDRTDSLGLTFILDLTEKLGLEVGAIRSERDSTDIERDRSTLSIIASASFGKDLLPW